MRLMNEIVDPTECYVTPRIRHVEQPGDGYVDPKLFEVVPFDGSGEAVDVLNPGENVRFGSVNAAVDRMSRFALGTPARTAFAMSLLDSQIFVMETATVSRLIDAIEDFEDDGSIINAVKLSGFSVEWRNANIVFWEPMERINPDEATIENVRTMVARSLRFFKPDGSKLPGGFTLARENLVPVDIGPGEAMVPDTIWDLRTSEALPTKEDTLRLLVYWRMGLRSDCPWEFQGAKYLGIYNPRLNEARRISVDDIPKEAIDAVEKGFE